MSRLACLVMGSLVLTGKLYAHEFWIEPSVLMPALDEKLNVQVRVGEHFEGELFPFQPRAYEAAYWIGPETVLPLHTQPLAQRDLSLSAQGDGLHILAIASFGRTLTYTSLSEFEAFAAEVGASAVLAGVQLQAEQDGTLQETYRRFSKMLVHFGSKSGADKRLGLEYEWVQSDKGIALFSPQGRVPHHPVDLFCRQSNGQVRQHRLYTDSTGQVLPDVAMAERCMINAVFLTPSKTSKRWSSDWVSMFWVN
ncbi:DUF4198 domain-containing protein [uncultured Tateyamaria sp.]|uniref:DUF4198 domain-containing protein n=1 Tax=uncultured Tateyamaria sp. TaxID=455651 RepID=UPI00262A60E2|nr:DUF4198 domain-containing protein [uncultured Tateyamaria sp.]